MKFLKLKWRYIEILISIFILYILVEKFNININFIIFKNSGIFYNIIYVTLLTFSIILVSYRYYIILKQSFKTLKLWEVVKPVFSSQLYNLIMPANIGTDLYKINSLKKYIPIKKLTFLTVIDKVYGLIGLIFIFILSIIINPEYYYNIDFRINKIYEIIILISSLILILSTIFISIKYKIKYHLIYIYISIKSIILAATSHFLIILGCSLLIYTSTNMAIFHPVILAYCMSGIINILPITIGGIGVREGVFIYVLGQYSIPNETSFMVSLCITLVPTLIGFISIILLKKNKP
jgi:uncharacterized membrane protein YbhN (UPF0104 family)